MYLSHQVLWFLVLASIITYFCSLRLFIISLLSDPLRLHHSVQTFPDDEIPEEFVCPISKQVCLQPTIAVSGFTYDLPNIVRWICQQSDDSNNDSEPKDPITREPISFNDLYPNLALRKSILRWNNEIISKGQDSSAVRERHMQKEE